MEQLRRREYWLVVLLIVWGTLLGIAFLAMPVRDVIALDAADEPVVPPYPTVPPPPTVVPPVTERLDQDETLDEQDAFGVVVTNESCLVDPLTATVGIFATNPITTYFPVTGSFEAFGGYRYVRVVGTNCSEPLCAHLLTAKFYYTPSSASEYHLWYWNWQEREWQRTDEAGGLDSQAYPPDAWTLETFDCEGSPLALPDLSTGIVFAWGYTTTAPVSWNVYLPMVVKNSGS